MRQPPCLPAAVLMKHDIEVEPAFSLLAPPPPRVKPLKAVVPLRGGLAFGRRLLVLVHKTVDLTGAGSEPGRGLNNWRVGSMAVLDRFLGQQTQGRPTPA